MIRNSLQRQSDLSRLSHPERGGLILQLWAMVQMLTVQIHEWQARLHLNSQNLLGRPPSSDQRHKPKPQSLRKAGLRADRWAQGAAQGSQGRRPAPNGRARCPCCPCAARVLRRQPEQFGRGEFDGGLPKSFPCARGERIGMRRATRALPSPPAVATAIIGRACGLGTRSPAAQMATAMAVNGADTRFFRPLIAFSRGRPGSALPAVTRAAWHRGRQTPVLA